jgi:hypothetical protein
MFPVYEIELGKRGLYRDLIHSVQIALGTPLNRVKEDVTLGNSYDLQVVIQSVP